MLLQISNFAGRVCMSYADWAYIPTGLALIGFWFSHQRIYNCWYTKEIIVCKSKAAKHLGQWRPDALFQCRCREIGIMHRCATGSGALVLFAWCISIIWRNNLLFIGSAQSQLYWWLWLCLIIIYMAKQHIN